MIFSALFDVLFAAADFCNYNFDYDLLLAGGKS